MQSFNSVMCKMWSWVLTYALCGIAFVVTAFPSHRAEAKSLDVLPAIYFRLLSPGVSPLGTRFPSAGAAFADFAAKAAEVCRDPQQRCTAVSNFRPAAIGSVINGTPVSYEYDWKLLKSDGQVEYEGTDLTPEFRIS
jgi:hypothetical protein